MGFDEGSGRCPGWPPSLNSRRNASTRGSAPSGLPQPGQPLCGGLGFSTCLEMLESVVAKDEHTVEFRLNGLYATQQITTEVRSVVTQAVDQARKRDMTMSRPAFKSLLEKHAPQHVETIMSAFPVHQD